MTPHIGPVTAILATAHANDAFHRAAPPEVLQKISDCDIRNYSIHFEDEILSSYFKYQRANLGADMAKLAAVIVEPCA